MGKHQKLFDFSIHYMNTIILVLHLTTTLNNLHYNQPTLWGGKTKTKNPFSNIPYQSTTTRMRVTMKESQPSQLPLPLVLVVHMKGWAGSNFLDLALHSERSLISLTSVLPYPSKWQVAWLDMLHTADLQCPTQLPIP